MRSFTPEALNAGSHRVVTLALSSLVKSSVRTICKREYIYVRLLRGTYPRWGYYQGIASQSASNLKQFPHRKEPNKKQKNKKPPEESVLQPTQSFKHLEQPAENKIPCHEQLTGMAEAKFTV